MLNAYLLKYFDVSLEDYFAVHPEDYQRDEEREAKFGFSFATRGFLIRR